MQREAILSAEVRPTTKTIRWESIPLEMQETPRWVPWNWCRKGGKWTKKPEGKSNDPSTWASFGAVLNQYRDANCDGIGFVLGDGWAGIDLDGSRDVDGELTPLAQEIIAEIDSYAEVSPTGTGVKIYLRGSLPQGSGTKSDNGDVEVYTSGRFFCVTGDDISGDSFDEVTDRQTELEAVHARYVKRSVVSPPPYFGEDGPAETPPPLDEVECPSTSSASGGTGPAVEAMRRHKPKKSENDGTNRLFAWSCRAVEHNLSDAEAIAAIRTVAIEHPFPISYTDAEIVTRIRDAEKRVVRGTAKRSIYIGADFPKVIGECVAALADADVYQHLGRLTTILHTPPKCKYAAVDNGAPRLAFIPRDGMLETMTAAADYFCHDGRTKETKRTLPKAELRNAVYARGSYPSVRPIYGVVCRPILLPTGEIVKAPGYHAESGLYLHIEGDWPLPVSTDEAVAKLRDVWTDFPFASPASEAGCFAALLTLLCRRMIGGNTPLFAVDGNRSRVGKGLLSDTWTMIADGRRASRYSPSSQDELRKYLTSLAVHAVDYVLFDNVQGRFGGATLEAAMTTGTISDRILGQSETIDLPLSLCWFLTANGYTCSRDMIGRTLPIMLDTDMVNPEKRDGFRYPCLLDHIAEHRCELLMAGLSIVANYITAGSPKQAIPNFGGFDEWSNLIRGAIVYAGLPDPLDEREQLIEATDDGVEANVKRLIDAWQFDEPTNVAKALQLVATNDAHKSLRSLLDERGKDVSPAEHLGKLLRSVRGRTVDGKRFSRTDHKQPKWFVVSA